MMRFLRGTFFRIGGLAYNDFEDINVQEAPPPIDLAQRATVTAGMNFGVTSMFTREYVPPPPRALFITSDAFDRGVGPLSLGPKWSYPAQSGTGNRPQIVSNHVLQNNIGVDCCAFWDDGVAWEIDQFVPDSIIGQYSQITLATLPVTTLGTNYVGVVARCSDMTAKFYLAQVAPSATAGVYEARLLYWSGSAFVGIVAPNKVLNWAVGDKLSLVVTGKGVTGDPVRLKLLKNTTAIFNITVGVGTAASIPGGTVNAPGPGIAIRGQDATVWLDNWSGGELRPPPDHLFHRENWNSQADGPLGQPWGFPFAYPLRPHVNNHQVVAQGLDGYNVAYYGETGFNASDHYAQVQMISLPAAENEAVGVALRAGGGVDACYMGIVDFKSGALRYGIWLYWNDDQPPGHGSFFLMASGSGVGIAAGGILRAEVTGNATPIFNLYFNGILLLTYTFVNTPTRPQVRIGGFPGFVIFDPTGGATLKLDNWEGGRL
jgi:hypothetical protein